MVTSQPRPSSKEWHSWRYFASGRLSAWKKSEMGASWKILNMAKAGTRKEWKDTWKRAHAHNLSECRQDFIQQRNPFWGRGPSVNAEKSSTRSIHLLVFCSLTLWILKGDGGGRRLCCLVGKTLKDWPRDRYFRCWLKSLCLEKGFDVLFLIGVLAVFRDGVCLCHFFTCLLSSVS